MSKINQELQQAKAEQNVTETQVKRNSKELTEMQQKQTRGENDLNNLKLQIGFDEDDANNARLAKDQQPSQAEVLL